MPRHDAPGRDAERAGRLHIGQFADHQRRGAHDAGEARRVDDPERDDDRDERRPERCNQRDRQQNVRKRHHRVDEAGDRRVEALEEAGHEPERHADQTAANATTDAPTSSESRPA